MTVNSYLANIADNAVICDTEIQNIRRSIATLQGRLRSYFGNQVSYHVLFGSYTRGTILPRSMDQNTDIDYMVVFNDGSYHPQTYLNKLSAFVKECYPTSEQSQSNPTIVLSLNHIKFELVPAIWHFYSGLQIPAKATAYQKWIPTSPNDFNQTLTGINEKNSNFIKPLIRLVKYWNAKNNYVFESFELEKHIAHTSFLDIPGYYLQLKDYFFYYMNFMANNIHLIFNSFLIPQGKQDAINKAKRLIDEAKRAHDNGLEEQAVQKIQLLLPPVTILSALLSVASYKK